MGRRKSEDGETSMESLMDALTNVVAVLIVILLLPFIRGIAKEAGRA